MDVDLYLEQPEDLPAMYLKVLEAGEVQEVLALVELDGVFQGHNYTLVILRVMTEVKVKIKLLLEVIRMNLAETLIFLQAREALDVEVEVIEVMAEVK